MNVVTAIQELVSRRGIELKFIRHRASGTVHVVVPDDPDEQPEAIPMVPSSDSERNAGLAGGPVRGRTSLP